MSAKVQEIGDGIGTQETVDDGGGCGQRDMYLTMHPRLWWRGGWLYFRYSFSCRPVT